MYGKVMTAAEKMAIENGCIRNFPTTGIMSNPSYNPDTQKAVQHVIRGFIKDDIRRNSLWHVNQEIEARRYLEENNIITGTSLDRAKQRCFKAEVKKTKWTKYQQCDYDIYVGDNGKVIIDDTRYHIVSRLMPESVMKVYATKDKPVKDLKFYYPEDFDGDTVKAEEKARNDEANEVISMESKNKRYTNKEQLEELLKVFFEWMNILYFLFD